MWGAGTPGLQLFMRDSRRSLAWTWSSTYALYGTIKPLWAVAVSANKRIVWVSDKKKIWAFDPVARAYYNNGLPIVVYDDAVTEIRGLSAAPFLPSATPPPTQTTTNTRTSTLSVGSTPTPTASVTGSITSTPSISVTASNTGTPKANLRSIAMNGFSVVLIGNGSDVLPIPNLASNIAVPVRVDVYSGLTSPTLDRTVSLPQADIANPPASFADFATAFTLNSGNAFTSLQGRLVPSMDRAQLTLQGYRAFNGWNYDTPWT